MVVALVCAAGSAAARTVVIGHSVRGRRIVAVVRGPNDAPRKVLVVGCIHGNECAGLAIISALERAPVVHGVQLWLVPEMNPDGTAADTRQNADGVDLNRNFPYQWERVTDPTYYSGPRPLSEPETRAAVALIRRIRPSVTIWYHQHQDLVDMAGGDRGVARRYAQLAHLRPTCLPFLRARRRHGRITRSRGRPRSWSSCRRAPSGRRRSPTTCARSGRWSSVSVRGRGRAARREPA